MQITKWQLILPLSRKAAATLFRSSLLRSGLQVPVHETTYCINLRCVIRAGSSTIDWARLRTVKSNAISLKLCNLNFMQFNEREREFAPEEDFQFQCETSFDKIQINDFATRVAVCTQVLHICACGCAATFRPAASCSIHVRRARNYYPTFIWHECIRTRGKISEGRGAYSEPLSK